MISKLKVIAAGLLLGLFVGNLAQVGNLKASLYAKTKELAALETKHAIQGAALAACEGAIDNISDGIAERERLLKTQEKAMQDDINKAVILHKSFTPMADSCQQAEALIDGFLND